MVCANSSGKLTGKGANAVLSFSVLPAVKIVMSDKARTEESQEMFGAVHRAHVFCCGGQALSQRRAHAG